MATTVLLFTLCNASIVYCEEYDESEEEAVSEALANMYNNFTSDEIAELKNVIDKLIEEQWKSVAEEKITKYLRAKQLLDSKYEENGMFSISQKGYITKEIYTPYKTAICTCVICSYISAYYRRYEYEEIYREEIDDYEYVEKTNSIIDFIKGITVEKLKDYKNYFSSYYFDYLYRNSVVMKKMDNNIEYYYLAVDTDKIKNNESGISNDLKVELETIREYDESLGEGAINKFAKLLLSKNFDDVAEKNR